MPPEPLDHIFPGSWINANFDVWIGAEEDNQAWAQLLRARETLRRGHHGVRRSSGGWRIEELLIAEGQRLVLVVRPGARLRQPHRVRPALSQPSGERVPVPGPDSARGAVAADSAGGGAGSARRAVRRDPAGHRRRSDIVLRMDWAPAAIGWTSGPGPCTGRSSWCKKCSSAATERTCSCAWTSTLGTKMSCPVWTLASRCSPSTGGGRRRWRRGLRAPRAGRAAVECAFGRILEARIPLDAVGVPNGRGLRFQFSLWQGGLPMDAIPHQGWLELPTTDPAEVGR